MSPGWRAGSRRESKMSSLLPAFTHIVNPKLKYIYLSFDRNGGLIVKSPKVSPQEIEKVLLKKAAWITRSRKKIQEKRGKPLGFIEGEEAYYLGKSYPVTYSREKKGRMTLSFNPEKGFSFTYDEPDTRDLETLLDRFYKNEAQKVIPPLLKEQSRRMDLFPSKVSFRKARSRWGSCSTANALSLNYLMMKLPVELIEYIVIHELAHIEHKHHQKAFWELVGRHCPDYRSYRNELKTYM